MSTTRHCLRILVIDEDVETYQRVREILRTNTEHTYQVEWLADGDAALSALDKNEHDCFLLDERVGETSGIEILREAKDHRALIPVILLMGHNQEELAQAALDLGAAATLKRHDLNEENLPRTILYARQHRQVRSRLGQRRTTGTKRAVPAEANDVASCVSEQAILGALSRREFQLYYQPQLDLQNDHFVGVEALLRWQHPKKGFLSAAEFIDDLEAIGLMPKVGEWTLRAACTQARRWLECGIRPVQVSINLSPSQLRDPNITSIVANALDETPLNPHHLSLEISESSLVDVTQAKEVLHSLKALGVTIQMDNFGTGDSTFNHLSRFPIDALKIDRSFVHEMLLETEADKTASAFISLGHSLRWYVVAESVESTDQLDSLRSRGCDVAQGDIICPPGNADDTTDRLREKIAKSEISKTLKYRNY